MSRLVSHRVSPAISLSNLQAKGGPQAPAQCCIPTRKNYTTVIDNHVPVYILLLLEQMNTNRNWRSSLSMQLTFHSRSANSVVSSVTCPFPRAIFTLTGPDIPIETNFGFSHVRLGILISPGILHISPMLQLWPIWAALAFVLFVYGFRPVQRWRLRHIPGPRPTWLLGNLAEIVKLGKHEAFHQWGKAYGGVCKIFEGGIPSVVVTDVKLVR